MDLKDPYTHFIQDKNYVYAGKHLLIDLIGCKANLCSVEFTQKTLNTAITMTGASVVKETFHSFGEGCGVTGILLLAESHAASHSWPELHLVVIDIFTCGEHTEPSNCLQYLKDAFQAEQIFVQEIKRALTVT